MHGTCVRWFTFVCGVIVAAVLGLTSLAVAQGVSTVVTYQGEIKDGGAPTASADLQFRVYDVPTSGTQIGSQLVLSSTMLSPEGRFSVDLDFGVAAFGGAER
jgi:hypothetical protein